ncbi:MAG: thioredoxin family protein [Sphingomicrobium sp.]
MNEATTTDHRTASRDQWLKERLDLLEAEKALTRQGDELARRRRELPWVKVEKDYRFQTCSGEKSLSELFHGRSQLLVYHFMFGPDYAAGCPSCSAIADGFNGYWEHLAHHDVMLVAVSRAPFEKLSAYKERMGWSFPWASSFGSDFNQDFAVGLTDAQQDRGYDYNFQAKPPIPRDAQGAPDGHAAMCGVDLRTYLKELPGMSAFVLDEDGTVYHSYSTYSRGLDALWGMYPWLDRAPLGRNESGPWWKRRDEYGAL